MVSFLGDLFVLANNSLCKISLRSNQKEKIFLKPSTNKKSNLVTSFTKMSEESLLVLSGTFGVKLYNLAQGVWKSLNFVCPYCFKLFTKCNNLVNDHMGCHNGPVSCGICKVWNKYQINYIRQIALSLQVELRDTNELRAHNKNCFFECLYCSKLFKNHSLYLKHMKVHQIQWNNNNRWSFSVIPFRFSRKNWKVHPSPCLGSSSCLSIVFVLCSTLTREATTIMYYMSRRTLNSNQTGGSTQGSLVYTVCRCKEVADRHCKSVCLSSVYTQRLR